MTDIKTEDDPIMGNLHCVTVSEDKIFSVDDALENASSFCICDLFEQISSSARFLIKYESIGSELNISYSKDKFTADNNSSVIFKGTGYFS